MLFYWIMCAARWGLRKVRCAIPRGAPTSGQHANPTQDTVYDVPATLWDGSVTLWDGSVTLWDGSATLRDGPATLATDPEHFRTDPYHFGWPGGQVGVEQG